MNAKLLGFFSGFPTRHFPADIAESLRSELFFRNSLVFISAWPADYARNDDDAAGMHGMFEECDMPFESFCVIDDRTDAYEAQLLVREADCIFLMGGNATQQIQLVREKDILDEIRESSAVILGVSAGSSNMAVRSLDIWESHVPYAGLGLADITIKAHAALENRDLIQTLLQISAEQGLSICAMEDESAIWVKDSAVTYMGQIHWISGGKICPFSPELLKKCI